MTYEKPTLIIHDALVAVRSMGKQGDDTDNVQPGPQFETASAYEADE